MGSRASNAGQSIVEVAAAAALGGGCAFTVARLLLGQGMVGGVAAASALTCGLVFLLAYAGLARLAAGARHPLAAFTLQPIPGEGEDSVGELLLDDIVTQLRPAPRVVHLFDVNAMATPGELQAKIDRHPGSSARSVPPDASDALHQALAELRRSLR